MSHSSAEAELYSIAQATVESLAIKRFIQELKSAILSRDVKITIKTDSSAGKTMASRLGISRKSKHIELKHLWIQDVLSEGIISLEKVGTHHNPSDVLTKFVQAAVLGQHLPKLNLFKDPALSQVFKYGLGVEKVKIVKSEKEHVTVKGNANFSANHVLSRVYQQACSQHHGQRFVQGQVCMLNFDSFEDQREREILTQRFRNASSRAGEHSHHLRVEGACCQSQEVQMHQAFKIEDHLFIQRLGQDVSGNQPLSATQSWSFTQLMECCYQNRHEDAQQIKANFSPLCQCHSGQDSRCSECALQSKEKSADIRKESITS